MNQRHQPDVEVGQHRRQRPPPRDALDPILIWRWEVDVIEVAQVVATEIVEQATVLIEPVDPILIWRCVAGHGAAQTSITAAPNVGPKWTVPPVAQRAAHFQVYEFPGVRPLIRTE